MPEETITEDRLPKYRLTELSGVAHHPSWRGWRQLLSTLHVLDEADDTLLLVESSKAARGYLVFANGIIHCTSVSYGIAMIDSVRETGPTNTLRQIKISRRRIRIAHSKVGKNSPR